MPGYNGGMNPGMGMPGYGGGMMPGYGNGMVMPTPGYGMGMNNQFNCPVHCNSLSGTGGACYNTKGTNHCCCKSTGERRARFLLQQEQPKNICLMILCTCKPCRNRYMTADMQRLQPPIHPRTACELLHLMCSAVPCCSSCTHSCCCCCCCCQSPDAGDATTLLVLRHDGR
jgi:hypothetical protein